MMELNKKKIQQVIDNDNICNLIIKGITKTKSTKYIEKINN